MIKNLAKNGEKPCSTCLKTHFSADCGYPKIRFQVPDPSLLAGLWIYWMGKKIPENPISGTRSISTGWLWIYWMGKKIHCDRLKTANTLKAYLLREKNPRKEKIVCTTTTVV